MLTPRHTSEQDGNTALHLAAMQASQYLFLIDELVDGGADLDCTNNVRSSLKQAPYHIYIEGNAFNLQAGRTPWDVATPEAKKVLEKARRAREQFEVQMSVSSITYVSQHSHSSAGAEGADTASFGLFLMANSRKGGDHGACSKGPRCARP